MMMHGTGSSYVAAALSFLLLAAHAPLPAMAQGDQQLNFKIYNPDAAGQASSAPASEPAPSYFSVPISPSLQTEAPQLDKDPPKQAETPQAPAAPQEAAAEQPKAEKVAEAGDAAGDTKDADGSVDGKTLKGYIRVVPTGTKVPIVMDTAIDSDTSQEGDEFSARTSEDLMIDGNTVVPAGSIIKGRIAQINTPRNLNRSGSIALKFDTLTTPDNRQIPLVATLVARKGVVHARRGLKDIAMDTGAVALPVAAGLGIGAVAGGSGGDDSSISRGGAAMIGAGVGLAVGLAILLSKKGKKVDVRPGDELKIELAEDLRMPLM